MGTGLDLRCVNRLGSPLCNVFWEPVRISAVGTSLDVHCVMCFGNQLGSPCCEPAWISIVESISSTPPNLSSHINAMPGQEYQMQSVDSTKTHVSPQRSQGGDKPTNTPGDQPVDSETLQDSIDSFCIRTGTTMQDQLHPSFIIIAFAFLFEFGFGSPICAIVRNGDVTPMHLKLTSHHSRQL